MGWVPFAFSVHHFISSVGADAGFASIIGLAILVLLYFAQARETANLREQAFQAAQRVQQLEARLAQLGRQGPAVTPPPQSVAPAAAAAQPAASRTISGAASAAAEGAFAAAPAPPAGVAAPPLSAATKLIPTTQPGGTEPDGDEQRPDATVIAPAPATVAAGGNGAGNDHAPPAPVAGAQGPVQAPPRPQPRPTGFAAGSRPPAMPPRPGSSRGAGTPRAFVVLLSALAVAAIVAVLLIVTSSGGSSNSASNASPTTNAPTAHHPARSTTAVTPSTVRVAVLNGTDTSDLAHRVAARLTAAGYKQGAIATASDQTHTATIVGYVPGHRASALAVASALHLGSASVQPVDSTAQAVACPPSSGCTSTVIVTVGSDLATS